jgi:cell fate regulator YaaT (PSP1 superfamily)
MTNKLHYHEGNGSAGNGEGTAEAENLAERLVAPTLRGRKSNCTAGCGANGNCASGACGTGGGCATGGCGISSIVELMARDFVYDDPRRIIEVTYQGARKEFTMVDDQALPLRVNDLVIVESERGVDAGRISMTGTLVHAKRKAKRLANEPLPKLQRKATLQDAERYDSNLASEREAMSVCQGRVEAFDLPMAVVDAEWQFDHHRITFFFTADGRVDFRELVRDLAAIFHTRIELRQISIRDVAKRMGGMGICGRELCCTTHLGRYEHITLEHAKAQQLQTNPMKLSGQCGRLKCCLLYEVDNYVNALKRFPPIDTKIHTPKGDGVVQKIDIFRDRIYLHYPLTDQWEMITLVELNDLTSLPVG